ncbi:MAG: proline dehydrogenase family protein, partial [Chloroflexota bacterium]|nr:proline dehydrogenase family protein [Chloroflexota bacterium]
MEANGAEMIETLLRGAVLAVAEREKIERFVRNGRLPRKVAERFVAGDTVADAIQAGQLLSAAGLTTTLDHLGENVLTTEEAHAAVQSYEQTLRAMSAAGLEPNISVKLTMLGLDISDDVAHDNMLALLETARDVHGFVRIDMEDSQYAETTVRLTEALHSRVPDHVGTVIQAYLHRSDRDVERLIERKVRVRLVKGAYAEPASVALQRPREVDAAFVRLMERLLEDGT